eukprot:TRINITY_DN15761_c0_g1_i2.p1 TRINITY_DN15761_c0_g1~~TRINITY_DN15761_c0_g1_i2.p1  ORF type:complete len:807 (+),score=64.28 TRINITY_DN15761_c0_g1_i2:47-2467(+)
MTCRRPCCFVRLCIVLLLHTHMCRSETQGDVKDEQDAADLREWWGNASQEIYSKNVEHDVRGVGYELSKSLNDTIQDVTTKVLAQHAAGKACASLPVNIALHAWRYDQDVLDSCLHSLGANVHEGASCTMPCYDFPNLSATLVCSHTSSGWRLLGNPPEGQCRWTLESDVRNTTGGLVQGLVRPMRGVFADEHVEAGHVRTYWGIPYAKSLARFGLARPLASRWNGIHKVDYYDFDREDSKRMHCLDGVPSEGFHGTEDCLYLDVHVPPSRSSQLLPVLVWLFGSGFFMGDAWQDGHLDLASLAFRQGVVVVQVSSRTAALGHWAHPALSREYGDGSVGNIGARDQRLALKWVQANIEALGGDPARVTLAGHSSGAFNTFFHLLSPQSRGLIHGAILESPALDSGWYWQSKEDAYTFYSQYGAALGCPVDDGSGSQIACLRSLPTQDFVDFVSKQANALVNALKNTTDLGTSGLWDLVKTVYEVRFRKFEPTGLQVGDGSILSNPLWPLLCFGMIVDGSEAGLPAPPRQLYERGLSADVPVYMNHESDEGTIFGLLAVAMFPWSKHLSLTNDACDGILSWAFNANASETEALLSLYPHTNLEIPLDRVSTAISDGVFKCPIKRFARAMAQRSPRNIFWAEHTFVESDNHNAFTALLHKDAQWFLGANHNLPSCHLVGFDFAPTFFNWNDESQKNHRMMNCHFALMVHCGEPGATPGTSECLPSLPAPLACQGLLDEELRPFPPYDPLSGERHQLHPFKHDPIRPTDDELEKCSFWDTAPTTALIQGNCRGCASVRTTDSKSSLVIV